MGLAQDALTHQPLGVFGIAKAVIGYLAASIGGRVDTESHIARAIMVFLFVLLHNGIVWLLVRRMLAQPMGWSWLHEPLRAAINAVVAVVIFALLDRVKVRA
jgi:rod shape-determining protein MreD